MAKKKSVRRKPSNFQRQQPISNEMFLPNHSGITRHPEFHSRARQWNFSVINPKGVYSSDTHIFIAHIFGDIEVLEIHVELNITSQQIDANLMHSPNFVSVNGAGTLINSLDTTAGVLETTSITAPKVDDGRHVYLEFDAEPHEDIKQMHVTIFYRNC